MDWTAKEAELRSERGWSDAEIREFKRGYEAVPAGSQVSMPGVSAYSEPSFPVRGPRVSARGARGTWQRTTIAGQLQSVCAPDDPEEEARERQAAKQFIDDWEYTYGRRPTMAEARLAVGRRSDGIALDGKEQIREAFEEAGIAISFVDQVKPLPQEGAAVTHEPVRKG